MNHSTRLRTSGVSTLRLLTFNISGAVLSDRRFYSKKGNQVSAERAARAARFLDELAVRVKRESVDLLLLQEVDRVYNGAEIVEQAEVLAEQLSFNQVFTPSFDYHLLDRVNVTTGLAAVSRLPILRAKTFRFSQRRRRLRDRAKSLVTGSKIAQELTVEIDGGKLTIVNAHLTHDCDTQKAYELERLLEHCMERAPSLLVGDLNTTPSATRHRGMLEPAHFLNDDCMRVLERFQRRGMVADPRLGSFVESPASVGEVCTYSSAPSSQALTIKLDYLLLFPGDRDIELGPESVWSGAGSNHAPVAATLEFRS